MENKNNYIEKMHELFERGGLVNKYICDIRNLKKLDTETINIISNMRNEDIIQILHTYNEVTSAFSNFIDNSDNMQKNPIKK